MSGMHVARNWEGPDVFASGERGEPCGCAVLSCGLVEGNARECEQHSLLGFKTMRQGHPATECPVPIPEGSAD